MFRVSFVVFRVSFVVFRVSFVVFRVSFVAFYRVSFVATPCFNRGQAVVKGLSSYSLLSLNECESEAAADTTTASQSELVLPEVLG